MLLMDRITQLTAKARQFAPAFASGSNLESAARFRLDEKAQQFVDAIMVDGDRLRAHAHHLFWPGTHCWFEWVDNGIQWGIRFVGAGADELHVGSINMWMWPREAAYPVLGLARCDLKRSVAPIEIQMVGDATSGGLIELSGRMRNWMVGPSPVAESTEHAATASTILAILSLLNSPRIVRVVDISRTKINSKRMRGGKFPLLAYSEVTVDLAKKQITTLRLDTDGNRRPLHWVRAHLRFRMGQWEIVKPHWRGDASIGIKRPAYKLTRGTA